MGHSIKIGLAALVIVLVGLFLFNCSKSPTGADNTKQTNRSTLSGKVVGKSNTGLPGVVITSVPSGYTTTSNQDGTFTLSDIEAGTYSFRFHLVDYFDTTSAAITFGLSDVKSLPSDMELIYRYATLSGIVKDSSGSPLVGAGIVVENQGVSTLSFSGGQFTLTKVESYNLLTPDTITILCAKDGYGAGIFKYAILPDSAYQGLELVQRLEGGNVSGNIVQGSTPVNNAVVSAVGGVLRDTTDAAGYFIIHGIPSNANVMLTVVNPTGDTMKIVGVKVLEKDSTNLSAINFQPQITQNNIDLTPFSTTAYSDQPTVTLMVQASTTAGVAIDVFEWDRNNDGTFDTTSGTGRLVIPVPVAGTHPIKVRAKSTTGIYSATVTVTLTVIGVSPASVAPGTYTTVFTVLDSTGNFTMHSTYIINPNWTMKTIASFDDPCQIIKSQSTLLGADSLWVQTNTMVQMGDSCTGVWDPWRPMPAYDNDTSRIFNITANSYQTLGAGRIQSLSGSDTITFTKISNAIDTSNWVTGTNSASGTYTWNPSTGLLTMNFTSSTFTSCGPTLGPDTSTGVTVTSTTMGMPNMGGWTRPSGIVDDIVGTWTISMSGSSWTATFNANGTLTIAVDGVFNCNGGDQDLSASANSQHWSGGYSIQLNYTDSNRTAISVSVTGPGITGSKALAYNTGDRDWNSWTSPSSPVDFGTQLPAGLPYTYLFTINTSNGTRMDTSIINCFQVQFATNLSPTGTATGTPTFSWTGIADTGARYQVQLNDNSGNRIWDSQDDIPGTSVLYSGPALTVGTTYNYDVLIGRSSTCDESSFAQGSFIYQ